jgi:peroxiredoxin
LPQEVDVAEQGLKLTAGLAAPDFHLPASDGRELGPGDFRSKSNLILFFIREFV